MESMETTIRKAAVGAASTSRRLRCFRHFTHFIAIFGANRSLRVGRILVGFMREYILSGCPSRKFYGVRRILEAHYE
jgi:hypothetical protein